MCASFCASANGKGTSEKTGSTDKTTGVKKPSEKALGKIEKTASFQTAVVKPNDPLYSKLKEFVVPYIGEMYAHKRHGDVTKLSSECRAVFQVGPSLYRLVLLNKGTLRGDGLHGFEDNVELNVVRDGEQLKVVKAEIVHRATIEYFRMPAPKSVPVEPSKPLERI